MLEHKKAHTNKEKNRVKYNLNLQGIDYIKIHYPM